MIKIFKKSLIILISLTILFGVFGFTKAESDQIYFYQLIDVDITVNPDSTFDVIEKQTYNLLGSFGYFYRDIELKGLDHISNIEVFNNLDRKLNEDEYRTSYKNGRWHVQWNFPRKNFGHENMSWTIKYKVHGGLGFFDNYDEIYWNAIFADRDVPVVEANIMVHLPDKTINQRLFIGPLNSKNESSNFEVIDDKTIRFWGYNIDSGEFLTIVATWPKGIVEKPFFYRNQVINWIFLLIALLLPIFFFIRAHKRWKEKGKDPKADKTIIAQYEPPEDLAPAVVGILINQKFSVKEVTATMINLAVNGYLKIEEGEKSFFQGQEYIFKKLKKEKDLKEFEKIIIEGVFTGQKRFFKTEDIEKTTVSSYDLKNKFYRHLSKIRTALHQETVKTNYITGNIQKIRSKHQISYIILIFLAGFGLIFSLILTNKIGSLGVSGLLISAGLLVSGLIGLIFAYYMPSLTEQGAEEKWKWLGFKEYLQTAERFRLGTETVKTFSKYLPYAIIFGVEKEWANRFADLKYQQPNWYVPAIIHSNAGVGGSSSFSNLSSSISSFSTSISNTFSSAPGGSGSGGGAGGGGGGGGGGAG